MSADLLPPTAALLIIGNEILSGRTPDANLNATAKKLGSVGIPLKEVRVVPDIEADIIAALNALRRRYTYVFTTGGIGPTHDDIIVDAVAKAFGVPVAEDAKALSLLEKHYGAGNVSDARRRMARVPQGAGLVVNPISSAPGIQIENVYVLAGVPEIMHAMLDGIIVNLRHGPAIHSTSVSGYILESIIAVGLGEIASRFPQLDIGSYPWVKEGKFGTSLVTRGTDQAAIEQATSEIFALIKSKGVEPVRNSDT